MQSAIDARLDVVEGKSSKRVQEYYFSSDILEELVQTEERYHEVKDALKTLNKLDFDKLLSSVRRNMIWEPLLKLAYTKSLRLQRPANPVARRRLLRG